MRAAGGQDGAVSPEGLASNQHHTVTQLGVEALLVELLENELEMTWEVHGGASYSKSPFIILILKRKKEKRQLKRYSSFMVFVEEHCLMISRDAPESGAGLDQNTEGRGSKTRAFVSK